MMPKVRGECVTAQLLRGRRVAELTFVLFNVGVDAAALAPPLIAVGSQTGEMDKGDVCPRLARRRLVVMAGAYLAWML